MEGKLGGFHFNDSKYGDDDLTVGSINPYQLFLIFNELVEGMDARGMNHATDLGWMIDASHNVKDPLEDLLQSVEAIKIAYAQALLVDRKKLLNAQKNNDVVMAQEILQRCLPYGCSSTGGRSQNSDQVVLFIPYLFTVIYRYEKI